ncbi:DUF294 nucleotidyltransferase-like domain-containing protein [Paraflavisolibacter sp. H34]|uniref:DUF294 nucleotidyltransferase-like domain-containing protein n=1 Tax=Huijunlia imazamoxiresistens TaxID=3127457 RepID=UPI003017382D
MENRLAFLRTVKPFDLLPEDVLADLAGNLEEVRYSRDTVIYRQDVSQLKGVDIIVAGEYESFFYDSALNKRLVEHFLPGFCFGGMSVLLNQRRSFHTVIAKKGTVIYFLHRKEFRELARNYEPFLHYFTTAFGKRMMNEEFTHFFKQAAATEKNYIAADQAYTRRIESVESAEIISCPGHTPVAEAARVMGKHRISCLMVLDEAGKIGGFITDRTIRDKVVALEASVQQPVHRIMEGPVVSIGKDAYVYEALLMLFRTKSRYLLVEENGQYTGIVSRKKLMSEEGESPMVFIQAVKLAVSEEELGRKWQQVPQMVNRLLDRGVNAEIVNQLITTIADTIAVKVIEEVIDKMGPPPAKFVFMVLGSEGRKEQTLKTDQDNAIIYEDKANEHREEVRAYFLEFAAEVSGKLDRIGFSFCTGGYMAKNPKWTHSLSHWKRNYVSWMEESVPETAMKFATFFDCRHLYGDAAIIDELRAFLDAELQKPLQAFFYHIARNALQYEPPLTFFKNIRTTTRGAQEVFDIKRAMTPIVDLVRVFALKNRVFEVNTGERLKALRAKEVLNDTAFQELMQSYYLLMRLRLKKQAAQIIRDKAEPDNYVNIRSLTKIELVTLKEIFKTIEEFQSRIKMEFTNNLFG